MSQVWYVTGVRDRVDWDTAISGGRATVTIYRLVRVAERSEYRSLFAREGSRPTLDALFDARLEESPDPVPPAPPPPYVPAHRWETPAGAQAKVDALAGQLPGEYAALDVDGDATDGAGQKLLTQAAGSATYVRHPEIARRLAAVPSRYRSTATPPAITHSAANDATTLPVGFVDYPVTEGDYQAPGGTTLIADRPWRILGNTVVVLNPTAYSQANYVKGGLLTGANSSGGMFVVDYLTDAPVHEFKTRGGMNYRLLVDGEYVSEDYATVATSNGSAYRVRIDHGSRRLRRHTLECVSPTFGGLSVGPNDTLCPSEQPPYRVAWVGDSFAEKGLWGFPGVASRLLGWGDDIVCSGAGGTGYLRPNTTSSQPKFRDRFQHDVADYLTAPADAPYRPVVIFAGGINDGDYTAAQVGDEAAALFAQANETIPGVLLIALSSWWPRTPIFQRAVDHSAAIRGAIEAAGGVYVDVLGYFTGDGHEGSPAATTPKGNGEVYIGSDGTHPNPAGQRYIGYRLAEQMKRTLAHA